MKHSRKILLSSFIFFILIIFILVILSDEPYVDNRVARKYLPPVSIIHIAAIENQGFIQTYAEIRPHWLTNLKVQVNGPLVFISDKARAGGYAKQGEILLRVEGSLYQSNVREAKYFLQQTQLAFLQEQKKSDQAKRDWHRSKVTKSPSDLALNKPQLDLAKSAIKLAESRLKVAKKNQEYTQIVAPFSGYVTESFVSLGQTVSEGETLLQMIDDNLLDIEVGLNQQQWDSLDEQWLGKMVTVRNTLGKIVAKAKIKRGGGYLDPDTRQYSLYLEIGKKSSNQALSGDFVIVDLPGRKVSNSLVIPEGSLTRDGLVWYLDDNDQLRHFLAKVLFYDKQQIIIQAPLKESIGQHYPSEWRIATTPLASFLVGNLMYPILEGDS